MISDEILSPLSSFFEGGKGPEHDELTRLFERAGLGGADPGQTTNKKKRVRAVLGHAIDNDRAAGERLVKALVAQIKANGGFRPSSDSYAGAETIQAAQDAFRAEGCELDPEGNLRPATLENLQGAELTQALDAYVRRARVGITDGALLIGTGKDLLEATARHVLVQVTGSYPETQNFPTTLYHSFDRLGLATPPPDIAKQLDQDPVRAMQQCLWLLGCAVNRLRHAEGTGHGRPFPPNVSDGDARLSVQAMGIVSQMLMDRMKAPAR
jgi:hypothetical protein